MLYLYEEIENGIEDKISSGEYKEGEQIPSELELAKEYNASRISVRRAVKELEEKSILEKIHGKGTFVKKHKKLNLEILTMNGFRDYETSEHIKLSRKIISQNIIESDNLDKIFKSKKGEKYLKLERIISNQNKNPLFMDLAFFPLSLYPKIESKIHNDVSSFELIKKDYKISFDKFKKSIYVEKNAKICKILKLTSNSPLLVIEKSILNDKLGLVHYSKLHINAKEVRLELESN